MVLRQLAVRYEIWACTALVGARYLCGCLLGELLSLLILCLTHFLLLSKCRDCRDKVCPHSVFVFIYSTSVNLT